MTVITVAERGGSERRGVVPGTHATGVTLPVRGLVSLRSTHVCVIVCVCVCVCVCMFTHVSQGEDHCRETDKRGEFFNFAVRRTPSANDSSELMPCRTEGITGFICQENNCRLIFWKIFESYRFFCPQAEAHVLYSIHFHLLNTTLNLTFHITLSSGEHLSAFLGGTEQPLMHV